MKIGMPLYELKKEKGGIIFTKNYPAFFILGASFAVL